MSFNDDLTDLDYLYATARARAMESSLLTGERLRQLCEAKAAEDAAKVLTGCGWENVSLETAWETERSLAQERTRTFRTAMSIAPNKSMVKVFMLRYDYHNIKTILKGTAAGAEYESLLMDCGSIPVKTLEVILRENDGSSLSPIMARSVEEAREVLNRTGDPQFADIALDRGCLSEMANLAKASGSEFLAGYTGLLIDSVNLRTAVRLKRIGRSYDFLKQAFIPGGWVQQNRLMAEVTPDLLENVYAPTPLREAAAVGGAVVRGEKDLAALETACDNVLMRYMRSAKFVGLGEQPLIGYVAAKEAEITAVRMIMSGRRAGLAPETILERLRDTYA